MKATPVPEPNVMNVAEYLKRAGSGLYRVRFTAEGTTWTAATWIEHNAARFRVRPEWILDIVQKEQQLVLEPRTLAPEFAASAAGGAPPADYRPGDVNAITTRYVRSAGGAWVRVTGAWRMVAACGAGIPDPGTVPPWDVTRYLGFANQVYQCARLTAAYLDKFSKSVAEQDPALRTVRLAVTDQDKRKAAIEGRPVEGELVVAADPVTFALLSWTPSFDAAKLAGRVHESLAARWPGVFGA